MNTKQKRMPAQKIKIGRVVKKKIDDKQFLTLRVYGKVPGNILRKLKSEINLAVQAALTEDDSDESEE